MGSWRILFEVSAHKSLVVYKSPSVPVQFSTLGKLICQNKKGVIAWSHYRSSEVIQAWHFRLRLTAIYSSIRNVLGKKEFLNSLFFFHWNILSTSFPTLPQHDFHRGFPQHSALCLTRISQQGNLSFEWPINILLRDWRRWINKSFSSNPQKCFIIVLVWFETFLRSLKIPKA